MECQKTIVRINKQVCPRCYQENDKDFCLQPSSKVINGSFCRSCSADLDMVGQRCLDGLVTFSRFEDNSLLQRSIHQLKYEFIEELSEPLGAMLFGVFGDVVKSTPDVHFIFCPLPLHPQREQWRGFNQSERICRYLVEFLYKAGVKNIEMKQLLRRVHFTSPQMELQREERFKNVQDAFCLDYNSTDEVMKSATVVLVDDVATTLSTLNSAAKALKTAHFERVYGLVLARVF